MPKNQGHKGETCGEAIRAIITATEPLPFSEISKQVKTMGAWQDATICRHVMALTVNLAPARFEWPSAKAFLFLRPDGQYELYRESKHPKTVS